MNTVMYYNGFNLVIDTCIAALVWFLTYRSAWWSGYEAGVEDEILAQEHYENKGETNG